MSVSVGEVMAEVRNYFPKECYEDSWTISDRVLSPAHELLCGDWVAIGGSRYNNGVFQLEAGVTLPQGEDESFEGRVWLLVPPPSFLALCEEISAWSDTHPATGVRSERFDSYQRENAVDTFGLPVGWRQVFAAALVPWRRMYTGVRPA